MPKSSEISEFDLIKCIYEKIFGEKFEPTIEKISKIQNMAYILKSMKLKIPYKFVWSKIGVNSIELYCDSKNL